MDRYLVAAKEGHGRTVHAILLFVYERPFGTSRPKIVVAPGDHAERNSACRAEPASTRNRLEGVAGGLDPFQTLPTSPVVPSLPWSGRFCMVDQQMQRARPHDTTDTE